MKRIPLDDLLTGIATAVNDAQCALSHEYLKHVSSHFDTHKEGHLVPKTIPIRLPRHHVEEGQDEEAVHDIPLAALTHSHPLTLGNLKMELDCVVEGLEKKRGCPHINLLLEPSGKDSRCSGRLTLEFSAGETPEGVAHLNDHLLKTF